MTTAWFQCAAGVSGDMLLGALIDAGAPLQELQRAVDAVVPGRVRLRTERVARRSVAALKAHVDVVESEHERTWALIRRMIGDAELAAPVRDLALAAFSRLAEAEATVHGVTPEDVHFHEVGALDAIADVVGFCAGVHALGIDRVVSTPLTAGHGLVETAHGTLPVPTPAVIQMAVEAGAPVQSGTEPHEMCTPTGVALLLTVVSEWGGLPLLRMTGTGVGAGGRDLPRTPNVLRLVLGEPAEGPRTSTAVQIDCNVDDLDPRLWPHVLSRLLDAGASDAWLTPMLMKKGRPAHTLSVLGPPEATGRLQDVVLRETSTIGMRRRFVEKWEAEREFATVEIDGRTIRVKVALDGSDVVSVQPEHDDVVDAARTLGIPVKVALARSSAAAAALWQRT
ncbi:nickel pincer cofactor biosynthesis protein LarC [Streptomyces vinaceus]|uniref:nickel pincer cofactor biosynthesis protein LarC n=1 Tax=Streptomyces vinaceus TaxID=1960 RepID=UPI0035E359F7